MSINRKAILDRYQPSHEGQWDHFSPFSVGNGDFAFTVDGTGLQSAWIEEDAVTPTLTMSNFGWHRYPKASRDYSKLRFQEFNANGRRVGYMTDSTGQENLFNDLRQSPHKFNLGKIGLSLPEWAPNPDYKMVFKEVRNLKQVLNIYEGIIYSSYHLDDTPVEVETFVHPKRNIIGIRIRSALLKTKMGVEISFPYPSHHITGSDWNKRDAHQSILQSYSIKRVLDETEYTVSITACEGMTITEKEPHRFVVQGDKESLHLLVEYMFDEEKKEGLSFALAKAECLAHWALFWQSGGFVSFEGSQDERASELQRRVLLSQYLLAIQCLGTLPPAETGLTCNSWYGKFHLEMHPWHSLFAAVWSKEDLLERSLWWYESVLQSAKDRAQQQGYAGARWAKMTEPDGSDAPSAIGCLLCWQQPHLILFTTLLCRSGRQIDRYLPLIEETLAFMIDYLQERDGIYSIGPPVIPVQENHNPKDVLNPTMEVEYWYWALQAGFNLLEQEGINIPDSWKEIHSKIALPPHNGEVYLAHEYCSETYGAFAQDHPSFLFAYGFIPGIRIDKAMMKNSLKKTIETYDFRSMWGWDFPAMAMTAASLDLGTEAIELLLLNAPKNTYTRNGHNAQADRADLPLYLPGNGALLLAVAVMIQHDSFKEGWVVQSENLHPYL